MQTQYLHLQGIGLRSTLIEKHHTNIIPTQEVAKDFGQHRLA